MLSKNKIKFITRLKQKKHRENEGLFIAEGVKVINELLDSNFKLHELYTTKSFNSNANFDDSEKEYLIVESELKKISCLATPNVALALFQIPKASPVSNNKLIVALDAVRDPGNLGTIIRLCDWFGVSDLVCNYETVDAYNSKVIQATMGSITRVNITYLDLPSFLQNIDVNIYGAFMDGDVIYENKLPNKGVLVLGNESNGISNAVEKLISKRLSIPRFGDLKKTESLNVATATAILLSEFRRG